MDSYEKDIRERVESKKELPSKLDISLLKFFWQAGPLSRNKKMAIPHFLDKVDALQNFSLNELRILARYLHTRNFHPQEVIFRQGDIGVGFYFILAGEVEIRAMENDMVEGYKFSPEKSEGPNMGERDHFIALLGKYDHFGELSFLQDNGLRSATATAKTACTLLGIFRPDLENIIYHDPTVGTKLLQSISLILANRLVLVTNELRTLKQKEWKAKG